jgi:hypothetical protein
MLLLIILCTVLYLNGILVRAAIHRFYNEICFYITFGCVFFLLGALVVATATMSNSWFSGLPVLMLAAGIAGALL